MECKANHYQLGQKLTLVDNYNPPHHQWADSKIPINLKQGTTGTISLITEFGFVLVFKANLIGNRNTWCFSQEELDTYFSTPSNLMDDMEI